MSSKARKRHEKAQDRAAAIIERTEKKVSLSKDKSRAIQGRRKLWEEINKSIPFGGDKVEPGSNISGNGVSADESGSELDDEMSEIGQQGDTVNERISTRATTDAVLAQNQDEDGIL
ncbi:hypothetical protein RRF57_002933 [Xylaria bambusicola]|uniref:Uncharacterized protein n=1 Tax=Xylaria bambusicola TaxID=326684 RepID=A0AAN7Z4W4_9PEZI